MRNEANQGPSRLQRALEVVDGVAFAIACIAIAAFIVTILWRGRSSLVHAAEPSVPKHTAPLSRSPAIVSLDGAPTEGNQMASVALVEYLDFEDPLSASFVRTTMKSLRQKYVDTGRALLAFHNMPIEKIHPHALQAAVAAKCAGVQGKFWPMHDALLRSQFALDEAGLEGHASALGLDRTGFAQCMAGPRAAEVRSEAAAARLASISIPGTLVVGRVLSDHSVDVVQRLSGAHPLADFERAIDSLLGGEPASQRR